MEIGGSQKCCFSQANCGGIPIFQFQVLSFLGFHILGIEARWDTYEIDECRGVGEVRVCVCDRLFVFHAERPLGVRCRDADVAAGGRCVDA